MKLHVLLLPIVATTSVVAMQNKNETVQYANQYLDRKQKRVVQKLEQVKELKARNALAQKYNEKNTSDEKSKRFVMSKLLDQYTPYPATAVSSDGGCDGEGEWSEHTENKYWAQKHICESEWRRYEIKKEEYTTVFGNKGSREVSEWRSIPTSEVLQTHLQCLQKREEKLTQKMSLLNDYREIVKTMNK